LTPTNFTPKKKRGKGLGTNSGPVVKKKNESPAKCCLKSQRENQNGEKKKNRAPAPRARKKITNVQKPNPRPP